MDEINDKAIKLINRAENAFGRKTTWKTLWEDCSDYFYPEVGNFHNVRVRGQAGRKVDNIERYTNKGLRALRKFASGMFSNLVSGDWFKLKDANERLMEDDEVQEYFLKINRIFKNRLADSNFDEMITNSFMSDGAFGMSNIYAEWDNDDRNINITSIPIPEYAVEENHMHKVDTVYRKFKYNPKQAIQAFGKENVSDELKKMLDNEDERNTKIDFYQCVYPNNEYNGTEESKDKPWKSVYIDAKHKTIVSEKGYDIFPFAPCRFYNKETELYGRSPAMEALADIKALNMLKRDYLKAVDIEVDPQWLVPMNEKAVGKIRNVSGAFIYWDTRRSTNKPERVKYEGKSQLAINNIEIFQQGIDESFFLPLFDFLRGHQNMTATEVSKRADISLSLIAMPVKRQESEKIRPLMERIFYLLRENAPEFPEPPQIVIEESEGLNITFLGKLSLIAEQLESRSVMQFLGLAGDVAQFNPNIIDNIDFDKVMRREARRMNIPSNFLRDKEDVEEMRKARQQQKQQMMEMEMANKSADIASKTTKKPESGSPLDKLQEEMNV